MKAVWSQLAESQLKRQIEYIREDSPKNADRVKYDIANLIDKVEKYPEHFAQENYKYNNDGSYRYFEKHRLRVSFRVLANQIRVVRVRHTSMKPLNF